MQVRVWPFVLALLCLSSCDFRNRRTLTVVLYPYIPHGNTQDSFESLSARVVREFEQKHPRIRLDLTIDPKADPYKVLDPEDALLSEKGADLVEIDALLMGDLVERGWLAPLTYSNRDFLEQANQIMRVGEISYGAPTWLCGLFEFRRSSEPARVLGEFRGAWRSSLYYLESWLDREKEANLSEVLKEDIALSRLDSIAQVLHGCVSEGTLPCARPYSPAQLAHDFFLTDARLIAYGEMLHFLERERPSDDLVIEPASFGPDNRLLALADALVINQRRCSSRECLSDAHAFIEYYTSLETQRWISLNLDNPGQPPRYLSSARSDFYSDPLVSDHEAYKKFYRLFGRSIPAPNKGIPARREEIKDLLYRHLTTQGPAFSAYDESLEEEK